MTIEQVLRDLHDMAQHTAIPAPKPLATKASKISKK